jgi:hypothetical protein
MDATVARNQRSGFLVVRIVLGILLLVTAGLKLFDPSPDAFSGLELLSSPRWRMAALEGEALLGLWLLAGALPRLLWLAALFCFTLLAGISTYLGFEGRTSCGCFGAKMSISPWYALGLDLGAIISLIRCRPLKKHRGQEVPYSMRLRGILVVAIASFFFMLAVFGEVIWMYGSVYETLLSIRGESLVVDPSLTELGAIHSGETRSFAVSLTNYNNHPVRIIGGTSDCNCIAISDLPLVVSSRSSRQITIKFEARGRATTFK